MFDKEQSPHSHEGQGKAHFLTLLGLGVAVLSLWTRKEPLPIWISILATSLLGLGVFYVYFDAFSKKYHETRNRWRLCRSVNLVKPKMLDFLSALDRFVDRDRPSSFVRIVEEINQLTALQERRLTVGDSQHLGTISRFSKAVRSQVTSASKGPDLLEAASSVYTVFWEYNSFVTQVHGRLQYAIQELSRPFPNTEDQRKEDEAIRAIRTKWNSFRDLQNAFIQNCLQLGEELKRQTGQISWGTYIDHLQTLE